MKKLAILFLLALFACNTHNEKSAVRFFLDLSGDWQFTAEGSGAVNPEYWMNGTFEDSIRLPGTTDLAHKGSLNRDTTSMHLNRRYRFEGPAWYRKEVLIPSAWEGKHIELILERSRSTKIWVDTTFAGSSSLLQSAQRFDLSNLLSPGKHLLTICVDNSLALTPYGNVHIYSDDTQTNWNGILGKIGLEVSSSVYITDIQVYPDVEGRKAKVMIKVKDENTNKIMKDPVQGSQSVAPDRRSGEDKHEAALAKKPRLPENEMQINLFLSCREDGKVMRLRPLRKIVAIDSLLILEYDLGEDMRLWDEFSRPVYKLSVFIRGDDFEDEKTVSFGMRDFKVSGTQFAINGRKVFLRGKHDAAVFPLTGFPPMEKEGWIRIFRIAKEWGINHYRFHSWCPPEAAFEAADEEGIYLQAELPFWGGLESDTVMFMLRTEGIAMLKAYANHPSFVLFSPGNEIWSGHDRVEQNILAFKEFDHRLLYTMGSNNNIGYVPPRACSDFFVGARIPSDGDTILTHTRLTHAFADSDEGGILNTLLPSAIHDYSYAVNHMPIPLISHEIGQYQVYPDYAEIAKYTGVLEARNLMVFRNRLEKTGMADLDSAFHMASGAWSALCYKAEMEAALRTEGLAGFQLLDLQDFPGQGTALVGMLDAFMDSKGVISPENWKESCADVVLLPECEKYCWTSDETFTSRIQVANYSSGDIDGDAGWRILDEDNNVLAEGSFGKKNIKQGGLTEAGYITLPLLNIMTPARINLDVFMTGTSVHNTVPLWIYPASGQIIVPEDIVIADKLDEALLKKLNSGSKVLLFPRPEDVKDHSYPGLFPPEFWNYGMFKGISEWVGKPVSPGTLGILTDPGHPLFRNFPTDSHTNWQWFSIIKHSSSLILDETDPDYRPVVQVIDNLERNHKLGLIFEFKVGEGKLLICMSGLDELSDRPEAVQLFRSILEYMDSAAFDPCVEAGHSLIKTLCGSPYYEGIE